MITIIAKFNAVNIEEFKKCAVNVVRDTRKERVTFHIKYIRTEQTLQNLRLLKNG